MEGELWWRGSLGSSPSIPASPTKGYWGGPSKEWGERPQHCASWSFPEERMLRTGWPGMGDGMVGTHLAQPQQCHVPSGAADGQWLPSFFSASGRNERKAGYQVSLPLSVPFPHAALPVH